jgi:predicted NUDIX family NTP pyrophosphohydrolase
MSGVAASKTSAGLLVFRARDGALEVLLAHMGGPFWARRDEGAWTIPKGEFDEGEQPAAAARREFAEELGHEPPPGPLTDLGEIRQRGGKRVIAFAVQGDFDPARLRPGTFDLQWPPRSGRVQAFPEVDRVAWLDVDSARAKIVPAQTELLDRLVAAWRPRGDAADAAATDPDARAPDQPELADATSQTAVDQATADERSGVRTPRS